MAGIEVGAPEFGVTVSAYTSYDKYAATNNITKDIAGANNCDPETLYNAGGRWSISTALMENGNYKKTFVIDIDGNKDRTFNVTSFADNKYYENISGLSWKDHSLTISFTFDGVTVEKQQTHHITGLPHKAVPPTIDKGWSAVKGDITWNDKYVDMYYSAAKYPQIKSPSFYLPINIDVLVQPEIKRNNVDVRNPTLHISLIDINTSDIYNSGLDANEIYNSESAITMESSGNSTGYYTIEYKYMASLIRTYVYKFNVLYR